MKSNVKFVSKILYLTVHNDYFVEFARFRKNIFAWYLEQTLVVKSTDSFSVCISCKDYFYNKIEFNFAVIFNQTVKQQLTYGNHCLLKKKIQNRS